MEAITVQSAVRKIAPVRLVRRNEKDIATLEIIDPIADLDPSLARNKEADLIIRLGMRASKCILVLPVFRIHDLVIKLDLRRIIRAENRVTISMGHTRSFPMHLLYYSIFQSGGKFPFVTDRLRKITFFENLCIQYITILQSFQYKHTN
jgi:hypothetical protein